MPSLHCSGGNTAVQHHTSGRIGCDARLTVTLRRSAAETDVSDRVLCRIVEVDGTSVRVPRQHPETRRELVGRFVLLSTPVSRTSCTHVLYGTSRHLPSQLICEHDMRSQLYLLGRGLTW